MLNAAVVFGATSRYGIGASPDSAAYFQFANALLDQGWGVFREPWAVAQPPLYPLTLAMLSGATGLPLAGSARAVNLACAGLIAPLVMGMTFRSGRSAGAAVAAGFATVFSVPLLHVLSMAWSEPLFIVLTAGCLLFAGRASGSPARCAAIGLLAGAACLTRYLGVVLIPVVGGYLLFRGPEARRQRVGNAAAFTLTAALFPALYSVRNVAVAGSATARRAASEKGLIENLALTAETVSSWIFPEFITDRSSGTLGVVLLAGFLGFLLFRGIRRGEGRGERRLDGESLLHAGFVLGYTASLIALASRVAFDSIGNRLLAPVYPSVVVVILSLIVFGFARRQGRRVSLMIYAAVAVLFVMFPARRAVLSAIEKARDGAGGYGSAIWQESPLIEAAEALQREEGRPVYSNEPGALLFVAGLDSDAAPAKVSYLSGEALRTDWGSLVERYPRLDGALLVWFERSERPFFMTPRELGGIGRLEILAHEDEGWIFRVGAPVAVDGPGD